MLTNALLREHQPKQACGRTCPQVYEPSHNHNNKNNNHSHIGNHNSHSHSHSQSISPLYSSSSSSVDSNFPSSFQKKSNHTHSSSVDYQHFNHLQQLQQLQQLPSMPEEREQDYCYGGYHPVEINEKFGPNRNYKIIQKLGWGHFSTVWLAYDSITCKHVALKIVKSDENYAQAARDEIQILERINGTNPSHPGHKYFVDLLDSFTHRGPNGEHIIMVFKLLGENLLGLLDKFKNDSRFISYKEFNSKCEGLPIPIVKKIAKQLCLAFDYLHKECGLIHTDIKPENILIEIRDVEQFLNFLNVKEEESSSCQHSHSHNYNHHQCHHPHHPHQSRRSNSHTQIKKSPIKCSKPLPSPLLPNLNYSTPVSTKSYKKQSSSLETASSISYHENYTPNASPISIKHHFTPNHVNICASEANSDDDLDSDEDDDVSQDLYSEPLDFYKTHTNVTTPLGSLNSRRSTFDNDLIFTDPNHNAKNSNGGHHSTNDNNDYDLYELNENRLASLINIKVADLGNACYYNHHFTNEIQTRQYRSPEVLLGHDWGCSADSWSFACLIFELITSDYLFNPKQGKSFSKNDDHIAQILELLHPAPEKIAMFNSRSRYAYKYFKDDLVSLRKISNLKYWSLLGVLVEKYKIPRRTAREITDFLLPLLEIDPELRKDFGSCVNSDWLRDIPLDGVENKDLEIVCCKNGPTMAIKGWSCVGYK